MSAELATIERSGGRAMIVADALTQEGEQRKLLGEYVAKHMQEDTDYGIIPGTKNRTLLKPGAEKLTTLFRCVPRFVVEEKIENWDTGLFFYRFACHIETLDGGNVVAEGVGSCNSYEGRYRWRTADRACPQCGAAAIMRSKYPPRDNPNLAPGWYCFAKKGGCGAQFAADDESITNQTTGRVQNPDLADCANTVLKMAKKRAHVDAAIALARCSDIFTQDVEDFHGSEPETRGNYDPRTVPGVKSGADLQKPTIRTVNFSACETMDDLRTLWLSLSRPEQDHYLDAKDKRKAELQAEGEKRSDPPGNAGDAGNQSPSAGAASTKTARNRKSITSESISDLVTATAERSGVDEYVLLCTMLRECCKAQDGGIDDMTPEELTAADAWLRGQPSAAKGAVTA